MTTPSPRFVPTNVTRAPDRSAHKFILTGRSGIGKTFFASTIPQVFFIPVEEGLKGASPDHDPAYFSDDRGNGVVPRSMPELHQALDAFATRNAPGPDKRRPHSHLVLDSLSGIEALVHEEACRVERARHMDSKEYKVVWSATVPIWSALQKQLDAIRRTGVHIWVIAHSTEVVDATATGDTFRKWDLQLRGTGATATEARHFWRSWADHVFFIDWVARVIPGGRGKRTIGRYEYRVLHTRESATYYAKTRARLPEAIPADWDDLARAMAAGAAAPEAKLRAQIGDLLLLLPDGDRALIQAEIATAKGANRLAAILSRAHGMLAVAQEEAAALEERGVTAQPVEAATDAASTEADATSTDSDDTAPPSTEPAPRHDDDDTLYPTPAPDLVDDGLVLADLAAELERKILAETAIDEVEHLVLAAKSAGFAKPVRDELMAAGFRRLIALETTLAGLQHHVPEIRAANFAPPIRDDVRRLFNARKAELEAPPTGAAA